MSLNLLRASSHLARSGVSLSARQLRRPAMRTYATQPSKGGSNSPWFLGSLLVFGPLLFHLTSPPETPKPKPAVIQTESVSAPAAAPVTAPVPTAEPTPVVTEAPKPIAKPYVLVGGGTASFAAAQAIKEKDPNANVIIISEEGVPPYMRPPLSKELWFSEDPNVAKTLVFKDWQGTERNAIYQDISEYEVIQDASGSDIQTNKVKLLLNKSVRKLNVEEHTVTLNDGSKIYYNKVLLATGGAPKRLPNQGDHPNVTTFRTANDFKQLDSIVKKGAHVAVVGGGFLGSELAVALAHRAERDQVKVTQIFPEEGNMANVFPGYLTKWTTSRVRKLGVDVKTGNAIKSFKSGDDGKVILELANGDSVTADHVVVAVGIEPRVDVAREAGLEIDEKRAGVVVNAELEARKDVFAAGDMVSFHDIQLGRRRIEHHDHAVLSGRHAGENMVGGSKAYRHQSMFWSDLGPEIGYEAVGLIDSQLSTVSVWAKATEKDTPAAAAGSEAESPRAAMESEKPASTESSVTKAVQAKNPLQDEKFGKGLVFYVRDRKVVGLVLFNVFGKVQEARDIINAGYTSDKIDGLLKKFDLHKDEH
ncbi:apoptosis-inducing factor, mitochondrion-associated, C-term-domain-containing protein [Radiomyces spectabilis]|uniref:apoptosis-inducing factor, mitochondrion-associated, C-term-domain-containing protein n=1 Tax=Radiomyces spectabilis TaxID=64574 RepID=UPI0022207211|nr:apoptosis-inducing factor, mitochondrion-associated, C-term-domain-containing protein [Radiomyces spectabilis]KAI8388335.1 apoptosis-inducing factor, mitochondrion-associated, C-term-domain-containing protein [Radiomyces spectabilis]